MLKGLLLRFVMKQVNLFFYKNHNFLGLLFSFYRELCVPKMNLIILGAAYKMGSNVNRAYEEL